MDSIPFPSIPSYQTCPKRSEEGIQKEESKKDEKLDGEKGVSRKKGKGRIHEVRYMDGEELETEGDEEGIEEENKDNCDVGSFISGGRKREEGDSIHDLVPSDSNGGKRLKKKSTAKGEKSEESGKKIKSKTRVGKLKIEGTKHSEEGIQEEEGKKDEKLDGEKGVSRKKGKGRIHEVRYTDGVELESEGNEEGVEEENEDNCDVGSFKSGVRKREEGDPIHDVVPSDSNGSKRLKKSSAKEGKSEESGGKKVKSKTGVGKLKIEGTKHSEEGIQKEESKKDEKLDGEKVVSRKKVKGRLHEIRYIDGDELESEGEDAGVEEENEDNSDVGSFKSGARKRKEGNSIHDLVPSYSNGGKGPKKSSAKGGKSVESGGKKVKSKTEVGKLKDRAKKDVVKDKKTKKNWSGR